MCEKYTRKHSVYIIRHWLYVNFSIYYISCKVLYVCWFCMLAVSLVNNDNPFFCFVNFATNFSAYPEDSMSCKEFQNMESDFFVHEATYWIRCFGAPQNILNYLFENRVSLSGCVFAEKQSTCDQ